jgi:hypothetical protein
MDQPKFYQPWAKPLAVATATYAYQVLLYMQRRPELEMDKIGNVTGQFLLNVKHVKDEHYQSYYEALRGVIMSLVKYAQLEEACSKSGAYNTDRLKTLDAIHLAITKFENPENPKEHVYLQSMLQSSSSLSI